MITPFMVQPAATIDDNSPMTVVDLRGFAAELSNLQGDYFIGFMVPEDTVKITMATLAAGRSYSFSGAWGAAAYDFHFRAVTTGAGGTGPAAFFDDFEDGTGNWNLTGQWGLTEDHSYSPTHSLTDSPGGIYPPDLESYATMSTGVDLSNPDILSADVSFWAIYDIEGGNFDFVYVEASDDDFATFVTIATFLGEGNLDPWIEYSYPLGAFLGSNNVKVRFHFSSDGGYEVDGFYVDDFEISVKDYDDAPPYIAYPDPPTYYQGKLGDFEIVTTITDISGIASAEVIYSIDGGTDMTLPGVNTSGDEYIFTIPEQEPGALVDFFLRATDGSPASNVGETDGYAYVAGEYVFYDDPAVAFYSNVLTNEGVTVQFTFEEPTQLVTGLIRNYEASNLPPNREFEFHVWDDAGGIPGVDMITPFMVQPAATNENNSPMTLIDLRDYANELSGLLGNYYIGFMVPEDTVKITMANPIAYRSYVYTGGAWAAAAYDFHFRCVTTGSQVGIPELDNNLRIYPNPLTNKSVIEFNTDISIEDIYLEVYSLMGNKVDVKYTKTDDQIEIFKEGLANGTYIFRLFSNKELIGQGKLIVQ